MPVNCAPANESVGSPAPPSAEDIPKARLWRCNENADDDDDEGSILIAVPVAAAAARVAADTGGKFVVLELKEPPFIGLG